MSPKILVMSSKILVMSSKIYSHVAQSFSHVTQNKKSSHLKKQILKSSDLQTVNKQLLVSWEFCITKAL